MLPQAARSTLEADFLGELKKAFEAEHPDLSIAWQKDSTGVITARILKGTQKLEAAQRLLDFAASRSANEVYARFIQQVAIEGIAKAIPFYPEGVAASMIKNDLVWAAENRDRIVAEWARRYGRK